MACSLCEQGLPFVCKASDDPDGNFSRSCVDYLPLVFRKGAIALDQEQCLVRRDAEATRGTPIHPVMKTISADPVLWHGNG